MSGETEHTAGEWMFQGIDPWNDASGNFVQWGAYRISARSLDREYEGYYFIGTLSNANDNAENEANARLIVAAPKMLNALRMIADGFARGAIKSKLMLANADDEAADTMPMYPSDIVRAAIALATGA